MSTFGIVFRVNGDPVPKQSMRTRSDGRNYTDPKVKAWQDEITLRAKEAIAPFRNWEMFKGAVEVRLHFVLPDRKRRDLDNLSKNCLDGIQGVLFADDAQVEKLTIVKMWTGTPGVDCWVDPL